MKIIPFHMSQSSSAGYQRANITDESIIKGIINHDEAAIGAVYREYHQKIKKMVYTFRNTTLDPDDIFQEGLTRAIINIREGRFRGESSFLTYLNSICRNICLKELSRKQSGPIGTRDVIVEDNPTDFEALDQLLKIRNQLDEKCRTIIDLRFGLETEGTGKSKAFEEIAAELGLSPDNARQRFKRCLDKLREFVRGNLELKEMLFS
jgi:RNA polymerase sigma factor (sigma-70 family)